MFRGMVIYAAIKFLGMGNCFIQDIPKYKSFGLFWFCTAILGGKSK